VTQMSKCDMGKTVVTDSTGSREERQHFASRDLLLETTEIRTKTQSELHCMAFVMECTLVLFSLHGNQ